MHRKRFLIGGLIILAAIAFLVSRGMQQAMVYFRTPSEIKGNEAKYNSQSLRVGGMVVKGSLHRNADGLTYRFQLTDGNANIPVYFHGVPPDLDPTANLCASAAWSSKARSTGTPTASPTASN